MARRRDWDASRWKKRRPLVTWGEDRDNKLKAKQLAARIAKGKRSANAKTSGPVKVYSDEEREAFAKSIGLAVVDRDAPPWR